MGKVFGIIAVMYILYYAGNIIYDLFIKKDNTVASDQSEDFAIGDIPDDLQNVVIDDVENIRTPTSFNIISNNDDMEENDTKPDEASWTKKYEEENRMNSISNQTSANLGLKEIKENENDAWEKMMLKASTSVSVVKDDEGNFIYKSTLQFT